MTRHLILFIGCLQLPSFHAAASAKIPIVPRWMRFEHAFKSTIEYSNALQDVTLTVLFKSPLGEITQVEGFWDGGKTWRVRFVAGQPGHWVFRATCSDPNNAGLNNQKGVFLCSADLGTNRFHDHGPVRVAADHRHFEHADHTPFFWLADTVWNGARESSTKDWDLYARVRASQGYTVAQWSVLPGSDSSNESAISGFSDRINVNPDFFKHLETKLERLAQGGILSAIAPLCELDSQVPGLALPEEQAAPLLRYMLARWSAEPVVWLVVFDADNKGKKAKRWKAIGEAAFAGSNRQPVLVYSGRDPAALQEFRNEPWVNAWGVQIGTGESGLAMPDQLSPDKKPARPVIVFTPSENGLAAEGKKRFSSAEVRQAAYSGLLMSVPAGVSYGGYGVVNWDETVIPQAEKAPGANLPLWQKTMFMPAAKQMGFMAYFMNQIEFWRLRPAPSAAGQQNVAAVSESKDAGMVYVVQARTLEVPLDLLPPSPRVTWVNPRSGETSPAVAVVVGQACQFPTPEAGDWVLQITAMKREAEK
jgi:hypothetical protein